MTFSWMVAPYSAEVFATRFRRVVFIALLVLCSSAGSASAEDKAEGQRLFQRGQALFVDGRYLEAARAFEEGYTVAPRTGFLINIAHSYRRAGELEKAKSYYEKLLELEPNLPEPQRAEVEGNIRSIDDALMLQGLPPLKEEEPVVTPPPAPHPALTLREDVEREERERTRTRNVESDTSVFGKAWFWGLLLTAAAGAGLVAYLVLDTDKGCQYDACLRE